MTDRRWFVVTAAVLAAFNVARATGLLGTSDVVQALGLIAVLVLIAWRARLSADDLGLCRVDAGRGAAYGAAAFGAVTAVMLIVAAIPFTSSFLDDSRADVSGPEVVRKVLVSILLATVIPEELAFRGVLLATGRRGWSARTSVLASSALFGLWHIAPTLSTMSHNDGLGSTTGFAVVGVVAANIAATFVAGLVFCWLRLKSRSLLAPVLAHLATNSVAFIVAWALA